MTFFILSPYGPAAKIVNSIPMAILRRAIGAKMSTFFTIRIKLSCIMGIVPE